MEKESLSRITSNPKVCGGKPCVRGMRIRVVDVLELLAAGLSAQQIVSEELPSYLLWKRRMLPPALSMQHPK
jgi:Protein of unknown function (DUF433)